MYLRVMKTIIVPFILIITACTPVVFKQAIFDEKIAQNLPPDVALQYLRTLRYTFNIMRCTFNLTTMSVDGNNQHPYSKFNVEATRNHLQIYPDKELNIDTYCLPVSKGAAQLKAATALRSLGIKTPKAINSERVDSLR